MSRMIRTHLFSQNVFYFNSLLYRFEHIPIKNVNMQINLILFAT